jgi:hypothetical protein
MHHPNLARVYAVVDPGESRTIEARVAPLGAATFLSLATNAAQQPTDF